MLGKLLIGERMLFERLAGSWAQIGCFRLLDENGRALLQGDGGALCGQDLPSCRESLARLARQAVGESQAARVQSLGARDQVAVVVRSMDRPAGALALCGAAGCCLQAHLLAQAELFTAALDREDELTAMTAELVSTYDQLVSLYGISNEVRAEGSVEEPLDSIMRQAAGLTGASKGIVALSQGAEKICYCYPANWLGNALGDQVLALMRESGTTLVANSVEECQALVGDAGLVSSLLAAPIRTDGKVTGAMALFDKPGAPGFSAGNQKLLSTLAASIETLIERLSLQTLLVDRENLERELDIAAEIQRSLLPASLPQMAGVDLAAVFRPAYKVGGDFYDVAAEGDLSLLIGDVASHGLSAALLMPMVRTTLREEAAQTASPAQAMTQANRRLYDDLNNAGLFVTALLGSYSPQSRRLSLANAGHTQALLCRSRRNECEWCIADCPPLGVLVEISLETREIELEPGDILVVYSDGLTEASDKAGELFGAERLRSVVCANRGAAAEQIALAIFEAVDVFAAGASQSDDRTLVILKLCS